MNDTQETFKDLIKDHSIPTWKNPLTYSKDIFGAAKLVMKVTFNPENWNYFPSVSISIVANGYTEFDVPALSTTTTLVFSDRDRYYHNDNINTEADYSPEKMPNMIQDSLNLIDSLRPIFDNLEDISTFQSSITTAFNRHHFIA